MTHNNRNIHISIRRKNYVFLKGLASKKKMTAMDLIKEIALKDVMPGVEFKDEIGRLETNVFELKEISKMWNLQAKQINSNIESRTQIDRNIVRHFMQIIVDAFTQYFKLRNFSHHQFHECFNYGFSENIIYQNGKSPSNSTWQFPKILFDYDDFEKLEKMVFESEYKNINQYIVERIYIFQNQSTFEKKHVTAMCRSILNLLKNMKNNSAQIWRNKKKNARTNEVILAKKIYDYLSEKITFLETDPLLYSGRKFAFNFYQNVLSK